MGIQDKGEEKLIYVIFAMAAQADPESPMPMIQQHLFLSMRRLAVDPALLLGAPVQRIHTIGTLVPLSGKH